MQQVRCEVWVASGCFGRPTIRNWQAWSAGCPLHPPFGPYRPLWETRIGQQSLGQKGKSAPCSNRTQAQPRSAKTSSNLSCQQLSSKSQGQKNPQILIVLCWLVRLVGFVQQKLPTRHHISDLWALEIGSCMSGEDVWFPKVFSSRWGIKNYHHYYCYCCLVLRTCLVVLRADS